MITLIRGTTTILPFRMVDSAGAAVTGLVDGDFTSKRMMGPGGVWGNLGGAVTEGEAGWYKISITEHSNAGPYAAYFSDGTNEAHLAFQVDDLVEGVATNASAAARVAQAANVRYLGVVGAGATTTSCSTTGGAGFGTNALVGMWAAFGGSEAATFAAARKITAYDDATGDIEWFPPLEAAPADETLIAVSNLGANQNAWPAGGSGAQKIDGVPITIPLNVGGWLKFRMVDSGGAAVTGLVDGDFTTRRYSVGSGGSWDDLSGTISEGEEGWYRIQMMDFEAESYGQAVAYFSDGANESHITFMVDDVRANVTTALSSITGLDTKATMALAALVVGQTTYDIQAGTTEDTLQLIPGAGATLDQDVIGATVIVFSGGGGMRVSQVVSVDTVLDTVTISPAMPTALLDGDKVLFVRTLPTLLDHPDGIRPGWSQRRVLDKMGATTAGKASGIGTTTEVYRSLDDAADAVTATIDLDTFDRTNVTYEDP